MTFFLNRTSLGIYLDRPPLIRSRTPNKFRHIKSPTQRVSLQTLRFKIWSRLRHFTATRRRSTKHRSPLLQVVRHFLQSNLRTRREIPLQMNRPIHLPAMATPRPIVSLRIDCINFSRALQMLLKSTPLWSTQSPTFQKPVPAVLRRLWTVYRSHFRQMRVSSTSPIHS